MATAYFLTASLVALWMYHRARRAARAIRRNRQQLNI